MLNRFIVATTVIFASPVWSAGVTFLDVNKLHSFCNSGKTNMMNGVCAGYIIGVADSLSTGAIQGFNACIPQGPTVEQLRDVVTEWLRGNPANRHYSGEVVVAWALSAAFPCR